MQGIVMFFNREGHYGFLFLQDDAGEIVSDDFFFHGVDVIGELPEKGDTVSFILDDPPSRARRRELIAIQVEKVTDSNTVTFPLAVFEKDIVDERQEARA
jgi:cold shock CspA family protein